MSVWFLFLAGGIVQGTIGPSPLTLEQCNQFAQERTEDHKAIMATGISLDGRKLSVADIEKLRGVTFKCIEQNERPQWGERH